MDKELEKQIEEALWRAQRNLFQWTCREGYRVVELPVCPGYTKLIIVKEGDE